MDIYVAAFGEQGSEDDPFWIVGAYTTAANAMKACQADAEYSRDQELPPIEWRHRGTGWWTDATPHGYRINRVTLDADFSKWRDIRLSA